MSFILFRDPGCGKPYTNWQTHLNLGVCLNVPIGTGSIQVTNMAGCPNSGTPVLLISNLTDCPGFTLNPTIASHASTTLSISESTESYPAGTDLGGGSPSAGSSGPSGTSDTSGSLSTTGTIGSSDTSGVSGSSGTSGTSGTSGSSGTSGTGGSGSPSGGTSSSSEPIPPANLIYRTGVCQGLPLGTNILSVQFACPVIAKAPGPTATAVASSMHGSKTEFGMREATLLVIMIGSIILGAGLGTS